MKAREIEAYRRLVEDLISRFGRDDIAVGEASEADGKLQFSLIKAGRLYRAEIPLAAFADSKQVRAAVNAILFRFSKAVEPEHVEAPHKVA
jgi:hypothetical protein